jgi:hypothetical protein
MNLLALGALAGLLFGLGGAEVRRFEEAVAADIASKLQGPAKTVEVQARFNGPFGGAKADLSAGVIRASNFHTDELPLFTEPERSTRGRVKKLILDLQNFSLGKLKIDHLSAEIPECRFDWAHALRAKQIRLSRSGIGKGSVSISEEALESFILSKFEEIKTVDVKCDRDFVWVEGQGEFLMILTQFRVLAKLEPKDGDKLILTRARIAFDGLPVDPVAAQTVLETLNPIVDLDKDLRLHGAITLEGVEAADGRLRAWGTVKIPERPK